MPDFVSTPTPADALASVRPTITNAVAQLKNGEHVAGEIGATTKAAQVAVGFRAGDHWSGGLWVRKEWHAGLEAGVLVRFGL